MSWLEHHRKSEELAAKAELATRAGDASGARDLYAGAAEAEEHALADTDRTKIRTLGISAVSVVSLYYKAAQLDNAERVACHWLGSASLPEFAAEQIRDLLRSIWSERVRQQAPTSPTGRIIMIRTASKSTRLVIERKPLFRSDWDTVAYPADMEAALRTLGALRDANNRSKHQGILRLVRVTREVIDA